MSELREITAWKGIFGPNSRRVFAYLRPQRRKLWIIAALAVFYVPLSLVEPYLLLYLVDRVLLGGHPELLLPFFVRLLPLFLLATCVDFLLNYTLLLIARDLHHEVKSEQLDNLLAKGTSFFRNTASGKLLFSFFNDSNQIGALLSFGVINSVLNFFFVAARLVILWYLDPVLLLVYLSIVPFQVAVIFKVMKVAMRLEIDLKGKDEELTARIESLLRGALTVKAFDFGAPMAGIWKRRFASRLNLDLRNMMWKQLGSLTITNIQAIGVFAVLFIGAWKIDAGALTLGALLAFVAVSGRVTPSLQALIAFLVGIQESLVNIERYYRIYDLPDEEAEFRAPRIRAGLNGQVRPLRRRSSARSAPSTSSSTTATAPACECRATSPCDAARATSGTGPTESGRRRSAWRSPASSRTSPAPSAAATRL